MTKPKKCWSRTDEERRLCELWLQEPLINPESGHPIERNGPTFNMWRERCKNIGLAHRPIATKEMTWRKCQEWRRYPNINPDTGREISKDGPTYKWIEKQCQLIEEKEISLEGEYYLPDQKGLVPAVQHSDTIYVVRIHEGRKVWGPLNKPAKGIKLFYYADTWDYHYNHYKPIFIDRPPPKRIQERRTNTLPAKESLLTSKPKQRENPKYAVDNIINLFIK